MFFKGSRYANVETLRTTGPDGREVAYKAVRIIPDTPASLVHTVEHGERLDHVAHRYYRDPERFWRVCDANRVLWPDDLVNPPGRPILVPPSEG
ncbi:MAG: hypothetical protein U0835_17470 [Isosphaeraceae bacterium]